MEVIDPDKYVARMSAFVRLAVRANGLLGYPPITMTFAGLSPSINEVWEYIKMHHPPPDMQDDPEADTEPPEREAR